MFITLKSAYRLQVLLKYSIDKICQIVHVIGSVFASGQSLNSLKVRLIQKCATSAGFNFVGSLKESSVWQLGKSEKQHNFHGCQGTSGSDGKHTFYNYSLSASSLLKLGSDRKVQNLFHAIPTQHKYSTVKKYFSWHLAKGYKLQGQAVCERMGHHERSFFSFLP